MKLPLILQNGGQVNRENGKSLFYYLKKLDIAEWNRTKTGNPAASSTTQCILLRNRFEYRSRCATLPYFFWTLGQCDVAAAAVCKKSLRDIGCVIGNGADYQGSANISKTGLPCLPWSDPRIKHVLATSSRAAVAHLDRARRGGTTFSLSAGSSKSLITL